MTTTLNISQQYKLLKAEISADRLGANVVDVRALVAELNLFENLELPYLTGNVLLIDDKGLLEKIEFKGTEKITFEISSADDLQSPKIGGEDNKKKTFIMSKVDKSVRNNDRSEAILISLIEEHFYYDKLIKVSKAFTSDIESIISEILIGYLNKPVDKSYLTSSAQGIRKINVPYMHPLEAVEWLRDRITTRIGSPFFTHASLFDNNVRISSLDGFLSQPAFNARSPFFYSSSLAASADDLPEDKKHFIIEDFKIKDAGDSLKMISKGALGALYTNVDIGTGLTKRTRFSIRDIIFDLQNNELINDVSNQTVFDANQSFSNKFVDEHDSRIYYQLTSSGTYDQFLDYNDVRNENEHVLKLKNVSIRNAIYKGMINLIVPGIPFMYSKISVGDMISCKFNTTSVETANDNTDDIFDKQKSGKYLIYATRHMFKGTKHSVSINATKFTTDESLGNDR